MNTIFRHFNYNPILITPSPNVKEQLYNTPQQSLNNQKQILFIDELDVIDKNYNFIDEIFRNRNKIAPFIVFCCCDIYLSPLVMYRKECKIFQLQVSNIDIRFILEYKFKKQTSNYDELIKRYNMDIRSILNNVYIERYEDGNEMKFKPKGLYKTVENILKSNIRNQNIKIPFYDYLDLLDNEYGNNLYELCYENYILNGINLDKINEISEINSTVNCLSRKYRNIFYAVVNKRCNIKERINIVDKKYLRKPKNNLANIVHEYMKQTLKSNAHQNISYYINMKKIDYFLLFYLKEIIYLYNVNQTSIIMDDEVIYYFSILDNFIDKEILIKVKEKIKRTEKKVEIVQQKVFRYKYKDGVSMGARMDVGIDDLFG